MGLREDIEAGRIREHEAQQASETLRAEAEVNEPGHVVDSRGQASILGIP